jgi:hypothetical protein
MKRLRIADDRICHHSCTRGAAGTGKSTLAHSFGFQLEAIGSPVVWLDVKQEFLERHWKEGDWVLNQADARCPSLDFTSGAYNPMYAHAMAVAAMPDEPNEKAFWIRQPRNIIEQLLLQNPTTEQLAEWLIDEDKLDHKVKGTLAAKSLIKDGSGMRGGIIATLSEFGRSMKLWPTREEQPRAFSITQWGKERKGSIFFTSCPDTLDATRPSQTMVADLLILQMLKYPGRPGALMLDEIPRWGKFSKLEEAISLQRSAGNPIFLFFQDDSQIEAHYGKIGRSIISIPYTQILMRSSEEQSAKNTSGITGQAELERVRESKPASIFHRGAGRRNYSSERIMSPVVSSGEIQSSEDLQGWISQAGHVTAFTLPKPKPYAIRAPRLIERIMLPPEPKPEPVTAPVSKLPYRRSRHTQTAMPPFAPIGSVD